LAFFLAAVNAAALAATLCLILNNFDLMFARNRDMMLGGEGRGGRG